MTFNEETVNYWNERADQTAHQTKEILNSQKIQEWLTVLTSLLPSQGALQILDVGTGSGFIALLLKELGHDVIGVDISPAMIQCAYEMAVYQNKRIEYRVMDGAALEFENERFNVVITRDVTRYLEDAHTAYGEWYRVLKKG